MQKPHPGKVSFNNKWSDSLWPGYPEAVSGGQLNYPITEDPNDYVIYITRLAAVSSAFSFPADGHNIKIGPGINSMGFRLCLDYDATDIVLDRSTHYCGQWFIRGSRTGLEVNDYFINRVRLTDGMKNHGALLEWKFGGHLTGYRSVGISEFNDDTLHGVYMKDCTIGGWHDFITNNRFGGKIRIRNCTWDHTFDDGIQGRDSLNQIEIGYCFFLSSDYGGMGASGDDGDSPTPGEWYAHHNIVDDRAEKCDHWRGEPHSKDLWTQHSPDGNNPRLWYNNVVLYGPDKENYEGSGMEHSPQGVTEPEANNILVGTQYTHQMFNNIVCRLHIEGTKRYDPFAGGGYGNPAQC